MGHLWRLPFRFVPSNPYQGLHLGRRCSGSNVLAAFWLFKTARLQAVPCMHLLFITSKIICQIKKGRAHVSARPRDHRLHRDRE